MRRWAAVAAITSLLLTLASAAPASTPVASTIAGLQGDKGARSITFVDVLRDRTDLARLGLGTAGSWFAQFAAQSPTAGAPTGDNARDALPGWVAAFNHTTSPADPGCTDPGALVRGCTPTYYFRTFSQDGPARSAGGQPGWSRLRLPSGECGASGAIVDPHTYDDGPNVNNTINRIQLRSGAPSSFYVSVVTDNTGGQHDPGRLELRGNVGLLDVPSEVADSQVEATFVTRPDMTGNGIPDVYVFHVDGFTDGDYLKLRLEGATAPASFAGLLFDADLDKISRGVGRSRSCR